MSEEKHVGRTVKYISIKGHRGRKGGGEFMLKLCTLTFKITPNQRMVFSSKKVSGAHPNHFTHKSH